MRRITGNPVGALATWLRQNEDIPGVTEALNCYKRTFKFTEEEFKRASALRQKAELDSRIGSGMKKLNPGLYYKFSTKIVYRVEKDNNSCAWRPQDRDWWSKPGDMVKLTSDYNVGKVAELTKELASKLGLSTGVCVVCGKTLTTNKSKSLGIGPVCIKQLTDIQEEENA
jgi:hypothetical protein